MSSVDKAREKNKEAGSSRAKMIGQIYVGGCDDGGGANV
jgi:hypothetical protein